MASLHTSQPIKANTLKSAPWLLLGMNQASCSMFGFLNPANVIQAAHTTPAFAHGHADELWRPSIA